jgi:hypothetical protein
MKSAKLHLSRRLRVAISSALLVSSTVWIFLHKASVATWAGERFFVVLAVLGAVGFFAAALGADARADFAAGFFAADAATGFTEDLLAGFAFAALTVFLPGRAAAGILVEAGFFAGARGEMADTPVRFM